ncbi:MAG TPA: hypothetical protein VFU13_07315 [Steroidobacteraceae bacterium]|nr:hypothetical protein [Steroidobacteraceae bacterium]
MATPKFSLQPGKNRKPAKRLKKQALKAEILRQRRAPAIVLEPSEYDQWLEHTVLARMGRGEQSLDRVQAALESAASRAATPQEKRKLNLAVQELKSALIAFQYTAIGANVMYMPSINGREALNVVLWPAARK